MSQIYMKTLKKMELPYKESRAFIDWYMETYGAIMKKGEDGKRELPIIYCNDPKMESDIHHKLWENKLTEII